MKPVGPEEQQVYWKRRALVVGIVVLLLLILWFIFGRGGGEEPQPTAASPSPSATATPSPSSSASPSGPRPSSPAASPSPSSATACVDADIAVTVTTSQETYPDGDDPQITMAIANNGDTACDRDVGSAANAIEISSGGVRVWSSDDCSTDNSSDVVKLDPGQRATVTVDWPRTKSAQGCPTPAAEQPVADPGFYDAIGKNGNVSSKKTGFTLE